MTHYYNQPQRRKAEFIKPANTLKQKVGHGGLSDEILDKAQKLLEENTHDFEPLAMMYLAALMQGVEMAKGYSPSMDKEQVIANMLYPTMQLKANGGMFHYSLVTMIADKLIQFLEVIEQPDIEVLEIVLAFHTTIIAILQGKISGDGGKQGQDLLNALSDACMRYFDKRPDDKVLGPVKK
ncbi:MAG: hypothetical protein H6860_01200 [Rhodospirillales bacterium]|nr:hypothetical protein [Alphaproteobacteria bacterium]MCB9981002.1 hypothetical protein [Rhodospirillales bacterium]